MIKENDSMYTLLRLNNNWRSVQVARRLEIFSQTTGIVNHFTHFNTTTRIMYWHHCITDQQDEMIQLTMSEYIDIAIRIGDHKTWSQLVYGQHHVW
jgi:hypothetical protein